MGRRLGALFIVLVIVSLACSLGGQTAGAIISVEINSPLDGDSVTVGEQVFVVASAIAQNGVAKIYLSVNGQIIGTEEPEGGPQTHITNFAWTPVATGEVALAVIATDLEGNTSEPVSIAVQVAEAVAAADTPVPTDTTAPDQPTSTPEPAATNTQVPSTTPEPLSTFTPTPTNVPAPGFTLVIPPLILILPTVETVWEQTNVPANDTASVSVSCPDGSVVVAGGFATNTGVYVYTHSSTSNGWRVYGSNLTGSSKTLNVYANCLKNVSGASIQQVYQQTTVSGNSNGNVIATCPGGTTVVGGGYASKSNGTLSVYHSTLQGNGWQVYATNTVGSGQLLNSYAMCLSSDSDTSSYEVWEGVNIPAGGSDGQNSTCNSGHLGTGGGFALSSGLQIYNVSPNEWNSWEGYAYNASGSTKLMNVYTVCLSFN